MPRVFCKWIRCSEQKLGTKRSAFRPVLQNIGTVLLMCEIRNSLITSTRLSYFANAEGDILQNTPWHFCKPALITLKKPEGVGFEPTVSLTPRTISSRVP